MVVMAFQGLRPLRNAAATGLAMLLVTAGCGGGPSSTADAPTDGGAATISGASTSPDSVVTDYLAYVAGRARAAQAGLPPIVLGWVNQEGGAIGFPEATVAAKAAVTYVNEELGGIGGHPLALKTCAVAGAEEEGQKCGQQFLHDTAMSAIAVGDLSVGDASLASVVAGQKPILVGVGTGPALSTAANTYILFGDLPRIFGSWGTYARDALHAKNAALLYTNLPGDKGAATAVRRGLESAGLKVKSVGFEAQATDLLGPVTAAGAQGADVIVPITEGQGCVGIAKALKQVGAKAPVVSTPLCLSPDVAQGLGGDLPSWTYGIAQTLPTDASADAKKFVATSGRFGLGASDATKVFAPLAWSVVLAFAKLANAIGPDKISPASVAAQMRRFNGPMIMGSAQVTCGKYADARAVCNDQAKFYHYRGKGQFTALTPWLRPPQ
jgi:branched-chain amino acid transport system substrate-binding protein